MCGIAGYAGSREAAPVLMDALHKLEYRGYDSAGIAVLGPGGALAVRKAKGRLGVLEEILKNENVPGSLGIAHTRWATHGEPSDANSHPHVDMRGNVAVVHNGIIENYAPLKKWLEERGTVFQSDTDTEVIAQLIGYYYRGGGGNEGGGIFSAVRAALSGLEGSYALAVTAPDFPDRIVAARKDSPLVVGIGQNENFLASDVSALLARTREVVYPEDGETVVLYRDHVDLYAKDGGKVIRKSEHVDWDAGAAEKSGYAHFMLKEIHEQPRAIADTLRARISRSGSGRPRDIELGGISFEGVSRVVFTACGTAAHAALVGKYAFEHFARMPVIVELASEFRYGEQLLYPGDIVIVISQSGETADTLAAMRMAKSKGARVLAITNVVGSTLAREAPETLFTHAGPEIAVASTKAFTTQLALLYLLALKCAKERGMTDDDGLRRYLSGLDAIPEAVNSLLLQTENIRRFASRHYNKKKVFFMGRQCDYAAAMESALKLKEINYTHSEAFAAGELKHGPIALVDTDTLVVTIATRKALFDKLVSNIREVTSRGSVALVITLDGEAEKIFLDAAGEVFTLPPVPEELIPIISVIPAQLFAYYCAVERGNDPDKPRNLAKSVTVE